MSPRTVWSQIHRRLTYSSPSYKSCLENVMVEDKTNDLSILLRSLIECDQDTVRHSSESTHKLTDIDNSETLCLFPGLSASTSACIRHTVKHNARVDHVLAFLSNLVDKQLIATQPSVISIHSWLIRAHVISPNLGLQAFNCAEITLRSLFQRPRTHWPVEKFVCLLQSVQGPHNIQVPA